MVIVDGFTKFVTFHPVWKISASVVVEYLERTYFPAYGTPTSIVTDNATTFHCKQTKGLFSLAYPSLHDETVLYRHL